MRAYALPPGIEDACIHTHAGLECSRLQDVRPRGQVRWYLFSLWLEACRIHRRPYRPVCVYTVHIDGVRWSVLCPTSVYPAAALAPACTTPRHVYSTYY